MKVNSKLCSYNNYADIVTSSPEIGSLMGWPFCVWVGRVQAAQRICRSGVVSSLFLPRIQC